MITRNYSFSGAIAIGLLLATTLLSAAAFNPAPANASACSFTGFTRLGPKWGARKYQYFANNKSIWKGADGRKAITRGHHSWDNTTNDCGFKDQNNFASDFVSSCNCGFSNGTDAVNAVDMGPTSATGCGGASLACTKVQPNSSGQIYEVDQRYSNAAGINWYVYTGSPAGTSYDLWSAAAHESGHALGLYEWYGDSAATMYYQASTGYIGMRTLGRGDIRGLRSLYPSATATSACNESSCPRDGGGLLDDGDPVNLPNIVGPDL